jgi:hypothetical protein
LGYLDAYQAYFFAELVAWSVYFVSMNTILKAVKMYGICETSQKLCDPN